MYIAHTYRNDDKKYVITPMRFKIMYKKNCILNFNFLFFFFKFFSFVVLAKKKQYCMLNNDNTTHKGVYKYILKKLYCKCKIYAFHTLFHII